MKDEKSVEEKVKIIKHPTLPIWGTKEGLEEYEKACKELYNKLEQEFWWGKLNEHYEYIRCTCSCHSNSGVMHIAPCCENGYRKVPKKKEGSNE